MARRGENIFKRKDGRWEARIGDERADGKRHYHSIYGKTYAEVKAKKEEYLCLHKNAIAPTARRSATFSWTAEHWLDAIGARKSV